MPTFGSSSDFSDSTRQMNASDFFSGAFNTQTKSVLSSGANNFTNIEIPDFLKR